MNDDSAPTTACATTRVEVQEPLYDEVAKAFASALLGAIARVLHSRAMIDVGSMGPEDYDLLFDIGFFSAATLENNRPFRSGGMEWVAHCTFAEEALAPQRLLASWRRTGIHGSIDDDVLRNVVTELASDPSLSAEGPSPKRPRAA